MQRVADYLARAKRAEAAAHKATGATKQHFIDIAHQWRDLARQAAALAAEEDSRRRSDPAEE
jgi:hypothetical protein